MTIRADCVQAEGLAGAIAAGEASQTEREAYRWHLASCPSCLNNFGGEREIERVMAVISRAREDERWEPDLRGALRQRAPRRGWVWAAALGVAVVAALALRATQIPKTVPPQHLVSALEARALAALGTESASPREGRAESLAVGTTTLSTSFELSVDERGVPVRCTITKSSGLRALDESVCRAAMHARYSPQTHH